MSYPSAPIRKSKSTARSDWSQIPYETACQMASHQAQWSKILSDASVLTSVVAKDFQKFLNTRAMCTSSLNCDEVCSPHRNLARPFSNVSVPLAHCNL